MDKYHGNDRQQPRCQGLVMDQGGFHMHQCLRKGVLQEYDKTKKCKRWWCKQHAPSAVAKRDEARMAKYEQESKARKTLFVRAAMFPGVYAELIRLEGACRALLDTATKRKLNLAHTRNVLTVTKKELED